MPRQKGLASGLSRELDQAGLTRGLDRLDREGLTRGQAQRVLTGGFDQEGLNRRV